VGPAAPPRAGGGGRAGGVVPLVRAVAQFPGRAVAQELELPPPEHHRYGPWRRTFMHTHTHSICTVSMIVDE